ncbi:MAG: hypothetical protein ACYS8W_21110 [Planctomycetota bacterium]
MKTTADFTNDNASMSDSKTESRVFTIEIGTEGRVVCELLLAEVSRIEHQQNPFLNINRDMKKERKS